MTLERGFRIVAQYGQQIRMILSDAGIESAPHRLMFTEYGRASRPEAVSIEEFVVAGQESEDMIGRRVRYFGAFPYGHAVRIWPCLVFHVVREQRL